jgi:hypothetical protein
LLWLEEVKKQANMNAKPQDNDTMREGEFLAELRSRLVLKQRELDEVNSQIEDLMQRMETPMGTPKNANSSHELQEIFRQTHALYKTQAELEVEVLVMRIRLGSNEFTIPAS